MKNINTYISCILLLLLFCSCEDFVTIPPPKDELVSGVIFTDDKTATASVVSMYTSMNSSNYQFNVLATILGAQSADELLYLFTSVDFDEYENNSLLPANGYLSRVWNYSYSSIYGANACIEGLNESTKVSEAVKKQLLGEAKFVRAFCHFYLVNLFDDVPLITVTDYKVNNVLPRTPKVQVYDAIIDDLLEAQKLMQDTYQSNERVRPNRAVATALLARVYLYIEQWDKAEAEASKLIANTAAYSLPALNDAFLKESKEAIWQLQVVNPGWNTWEGSNFCTPLFKLTDELFAAFEPGDNRFADWISKPTTGVPNRYHPFKYKVKKDAVVKEYCMVLRLAEQYLIRAEARVQQNTATSLALAKDDIDEIRNRAGLGGYTGALEKGALLLAIEQERRVELFSEWGHRWLDLKRTGRAGAVLAPVKPDWQDTDMLYPIPESAIRTNKNLTQNP